MADILQGIGALAVIVISGAWLMRFFEERREKHVFNEHWKYLQARRQSHPEEAESLKEEMSQMLLHPKRRIGLFEDPSRRNQ